MNPNPAHVRFLSNCVRVDQFDDVAKRQSLAEPYYSDDEKAFILRNSGGSPWLDVGCGSGLSMDILPVTHAAEPNVMKYERASKRPGVTVVNDFAENMAFESCTFNTVSYLRGFWQCRSMYESFMEINRVMRPGGTLILNCHADEIVSPHGVPIAYQGVARFAAMFGFGEVAEQRLITVSDYGRWFYLAVRKTTDVRIEDFLHPQLIPAGNDLYRVANAGNNPRIL